MKDELLSRAKDSVDTQAKKDQETKDYVADQVGEGLDALKDTISPKADKK
ncbi:hypothetical protein Leryth_007975 [Lithospermum erythrorhizon]|nr:hypothetical protein Leryth_007975 [Lithospermum erythrorhizon]